EYNALLPNASLTELVVRNWRAGDRFRPAHTRSPKKVKTLLQERRVASAERRLWPVVLSGTTIVWMRGFPAAEPVAGPASPARLRIEEVATREAFKSPNP
ncbi:MAG: tRNA lysidine(34) synthetase TilS, partial [Terriglobales bacterium]